MIAALQSYAVVIQAYAIPLVIAFVIGLGTARTLFPRKARKDPKA